MIWHKKVWSRPKDSILWPTSLVHSMIMWMLRTYRMPLELWYRTKTTIEWGLFWPIWWMIWCLCKGQFWYEWIVYSYTNAFQSSKLHHHWYILEMRWFSTYPSPCDKRKMVNHWQILTHLSSFGRSIGCLVGDIFWRKKVECRPMKSSLRLTRLKYGYAMIIGRTRIYKTTFEPSHRAKA